MAFDRLRAAWRVLTDNPAHLDLETRFSGAPFVVTGRSGVPAHLPWRPEKLAAEGYAANIVSYLCVRLVADSFASLPLLPFRGEAEVPNHPLATLLNRPNPLKGQDRWLQELAVHHLISGNSYVEAVRTTRRGPPRELYVLPPRFMAVLPGGAGIPAAYRFDNGGRTRDYPLDPVTGYGDVLHLREPNPLAQGEEYGLAPTQAAARWIDLDNAGADRRIEHSRGTDPDVAFLFKDITTQDQLDIVNHKLRDRFEQSRRQATPLAMAGNVEVAKLGQTLQEMQWTDGMHEAARRICAAWNVPHILVVPGESTYANREQARLELWEHTVLPFAKLMFGDLVPWLGWLYNDKTLELRIDEDSITALEPRRETIRTSSLLAFEKGMLSLNEARLVWGYEPAEQSDDPAEEPAALRNAVQASMLAEAQQEALRNPQQQQQVGGSTADEDEEENAPPPPKKPRVPVPAAKSEPPEPPADPERHRVPRGEPGAGQYLPGMAASTFARWLRTGRKAGLPLPPGLELEVKAEADDFADELDDAVFIDETLPVIRDILVASGVKVFIDLGLQASFDVFDERVVGFLEQYGAERVTGMIGETTRKAIGSTIAEAMREGERFDQIVARIRAVFSAASEDRAHVIARTETTIAVGAGGQAAMEQVGVERKRWISTRDSFVRDAHRALDGQTVPADQPFSVSATSGMHPGAMSGGAAQNCNCRCFVQALPDEKADDLSDTETKRDELWKAAVPELDQNEKMLEQAVRQGFAAQERRMVVAAHRRFG